MKKLMPLADLKNGVQRQVKIGNKEVICVMRDGQVYAFDGYCAHQGGPLVKGEFKEDQVRCFWHGCQFNLKSGICTDIGSCRNLSKKDVWLTMRKCVVENGDVYLDE